MAGLGCPDVASRSRSEESGPSTTKASAIPGKQNGPTNGRRGFRRASDVLSAVAPTHTRPARRTLVAGVLLTFLFPTAAGALPPRPPSAAKTRAAIGHPEGRQPAVDAGLQPARG
jgi:hypothetical protein